MEVKQALKRYAWLLSQVALLVLVPLLTACGGATLAPASVPTAGPPAIPHTLEGRSDCLMCHKEGVVKPFPAGHVGRTNDTLHRLPSASPDKNGFEDESISSYQYLLAHLRSMKILAQG